jgi:acylphosphatase
MSAPTSRIARRWIVAGRVQGVYFRAFTQDRARELGVAGWVRNLPDGRVECVAAGAPAALAALRAALEKGPPAARVTAVEECEWREPVTESELVVRR